MLGTLSLQRRGRAQELADRTLARRWVLLEDQEVHPADHEGEICSNKVGEIQGLREQSKKSVLQGEYSPYWADSFPRRNCQKIDFKVDSAHLQRNHRQGTNRNKEPLKREAIPLYDGFIRLAAALDHPPAEVELKELPT